MRVGIYAGTFDPVHIGHIKALQTVTQLYGLQRIIIVPAGCSPNKGLIHYSDAFERWHWLSLATEELSDVSAFSCEINTLECSYSADTVEQLCKLFPGSDFYFIIGEDNLSNLTKWYRIKYLKTAARIIVINRTGLAENNIDTKLYEQHFESVDPVSDVSSSIIRNNISLGKPIAHCLITAEEFSLLGSGTYLPEKLQREIRFVRSHQKPSRFKHTVGVVATALSLARKLNVNSLQAMESAYLHDIAKELPSDLLKCFAAKTGSDLGTSDIVPVLHAPAGAELAKYLFLVEPEIYQAIQLHCTLDENMTVLDKIIYISDMVEPSRHYPSVELLRSEFYKITDINDLDSLLILAIEKNICYISNTGGVVHPASYRALDLLKTNF